jgi:hypothetical protein
MEKKKANVSVIQEVRHVEIKDPTDINDSKAYADKYDIDVEDEGAENFEENDDDAVKVALKSWFSL